MSKSLFNEDWSVRRKVSGFVDLMGGAEWTPVTLPHDAMIDLPRVSAGGSGPSGAYFPGGEVEYRKAFHVPESWRDQRVSVEFEGVYRDAMIYVNNEFAGQWRYGYSVFRISLDAHLRYGQTNTIRVEARAHQDSRWYTGLGIYRDVHLVVVPLAHLVDDDVRITTPDVDDERAVVETALTVRNSDVITRRLALEVEVLDPSGVVVAVESSPVTVRPAASTVVRTRLYVDDPARWSVDTPHLYRYVARLRDDEGANGVHEVDIPFGIRTLRIDPRRGLRINDQTVKLRGACIHHDNGPLGSATIARAEERRIELLKQAGFNAIRSSHNPLSPAMLDACDRLGMLVFDESFDAWTEMNKPYDYTLDFSEWWQRDIDALVRKDFNHPSVILYCIGNEIHEYGSGLGGSLAREIAERIRRHDETRFVTTAISSFWAVAHEVIDDLKERMDTAVARGVNDVMNEMTEFFDEVTLSETVTVSTAEAHAAADVAGLNYAEPRYAPDARRFPNRVVLGTETNPRMTAQSWRETVAHDHVIGGFTWTGWDYLGEVGLGRTDYTDDPEVRGGGDPDYPWLTAWAGDIDIVGFRRPQSHFREIVYGLRTDPYIAVLRPQHFGDRRLEMQWAWSDAISSWTWDVPVGAPIELEVYGDADEIELLVNGVAVSRRTMTVADDYTARFETTYQPGEISANAYREGVIIGTAALRTAGESSIEAVADRQLIEAGTRDLAYVTIELRDEQGVLDTAHDEAIDVEVSGAGCLQALGTGRPETDEAFGAHRRLLFDGRAVAIIRPTSAGEIKVTVRSATRGTATVSITSNAPTA